MTTRQSNQTHMMTATLAGGAAIIMWALLALLTDLSGTMPPFQLAAITFAIGTLVGIGWSMARPPAKRWPKRWGVIIAGSCGLFAYHALYFMALRNAPAIEASLIAYLWPLLIVVGSALLPGQRLRWFHVVGALCGFAGTGLIVTGGTGFAPKPEYAFGYGVALAAAFTWATYSLAARRIADVPSSVVTLYCAGSAILALIAHLLFETTIWPDGTGQWLAIIGLGLLPVGAAFYVWDHAMKHGHVAVIGAASYAAPLLSSLILIAAGRAAMSWQIWTACILITLGAIIAAKDLIGAKQ